MYPKVNTDPNFHQEFLKKSLYKKRWQVGCEQTWNGIINKTIQGSLTENSIEIYVIQP